VAASTIQRAPLQDRSMPGISPDSLTASERIGEISNILAAGLIRLYARKSSIFDRKRGEIPLDCAAHQSSHADRLKSDGGSK
jgi:hypothetical protein